MDKRQEFARRFSLLIKEHGYTQQEIADHIGVNRTMISKYINAQRLPTLKIVKEISTFFGVSTDYLLDIEDKIDLVPEKNLIPILNVVRAGMPELIYEDNIIGYERVSEDLAIKGELFALKVKGDSMHPRFMDGDIVIVKRQNYAETGDIVITLVKNEEATIKLYRRTNTGISLIPINEDYPEMKYSNDDIMRLPLTILGVVIELRARNFLKK